MLAEKMINEKFRFDTKAKEGKKVIYLKGTIDEDTSFEAIRALGGPFTFNFRDLISINSLGVRNWVNFLKELGRVQISYEECPPLIVRQLNMVPSFKGAATVSSVFLPYVCDNCETEKLVLLPADKFGDPDGMPETIRCENCKKGEMEFDGHPQQYFAFAK